jgi:sigma-B regulation protein RsbU (phosphoserine phosphatase)
MPTQELICSEVWGSNGNADIDLVLPGLRGVLYSRACGGKKGGDVYYASACAAGVISRMCLADVAGHGEEVAQVGSWLHGTMRGTMGHHDSSKVFHALNKRASLFGLEALTTAVCLSYDMMSAELRFCYAGHPPALVLPKGATQWTELQVHDEPSGVRNVPFGVSDTADFDTGQYILGEGDRLFIYSDGVIEAPDSAHALFGMDRLREALNESADDPIADLAREIESRLTRHTGAADFTHDDVTFVAIEAGPRALEPKLWHLLRNQSRKLARKIG